MLGNFCPKLGCGKKSLKSDKEILVASYFACYPFFEGEVWCLTILPKEIENKGGILVLSNKGH